jgi:hypothetical protein
MTHREDSLILIQEMQWDATPVGTVGGHTSVLKQNAMPEASSVARRRQERKRSAARKA